DELEPRLARAARRIARRRAGPSAGPSIDDLELAATIREQVARLAAEIADPRSAHDAPIVYLRGPAGAGKRTTAEAFARALGGALLARAGPARAPAEDTAAAIVQAAAREARLTGDLLLLESADLLLGGDRRDTRRALLDAIAGAPGPSLLTGTAAWEPAG